MIHWSRPASLLPLTTTIKLSARGKLCPSIFTVRVSSHRSYESLPHLLFSNLLYFVYDLFSSLASRIRMHSALGVITSHPVSSPWLHLSSLHLFSMWYFLSHLLLVVPIWSLCWVPVFLSPSLSDTHKHTHTHTHTHCGGSSVLIINLKLESSRFFLKPIFYTI